MTRRGLKLSDWFSAPLKTAGIYEPPAVVMASRAGGDHVQTSARISSTLGARGENLQTAGRTAAAGGSRSARLSRSRRTWH